MFFFIDVLLVGTVIENRESLKKMCLGQRLTWSKNSHFLVSEKLSLKILLFGLFEKINFYHFLLSSFKLDDMQLMKNFH